MCFLKTPVPLMAIKQVQRSLDTRQSLTGLRDAIDMEVTWLDMNPSETDTIWSWLFKTRLLFLKKSLAQAREIEHVKIQSIMPRD